MFTEAQQNSFSNSVDGKSKVTSHHAYTLHKTSTFFNATEVAILRHAVAITPVHTVVIQADFNEIASGNVISKIFLRLCVLGFFTKQVSRDKKLKDLARQEQLKRRTLYKVNKHRIADLLEKLDSINDLGVDRADRTMIIAACKLVDWREPITTLDLVFFTTLSGTRLAQWLRGNKDLVQRVLVENKVKTYNHFFTKKIRNIARVWEDIHAMVALHSKMK